MFSMLYGSLNPDFMVQRTYIYGYNKLVKRSFGIKLRPRVVFHPIFRPVSSEIGTSGRANFNMGDLTSYDSRHLIVQLWIAEIAIHNCNILLPPRARSIIASVSLIPDGAYGRSLILEPHM